MAPRSKTSANAATRPRASRKRKWSRPSAGKSGRNNRILPRDSGEGGPRACAVEGARAPTNLLRRKRSVKSDAPSTMLRMVPLPRFRGGGRFFIRHCRTPVPDLIGDDPAIHAATRLTTDFVEFTLGRTLRDSSAQSGHACSRDKERREEPAHDGTGGGEGLTRRMVRFLDSFHR